MVVQRDRDLLDPWLIRAKRVIQRKYGDTVSSVTKDKDLLKFGRNTDLGTTEETVWLTGGTETLPTDNVIDTISSSNAGDTQLVVVEGHTIDADNNFTFLTQEATLDGQNKVVLTTPLARSSRIYNDNSTGFAGTVYVYEDDSVVDGVPQTQAKIHMQTDGTNNQSLKCATTFSNVDYYLMTALIVSVNRQQSRSVDFKLKIREKGKTFRTKAVTSCNSGVGSVQVQFRPYLIIPTNSDIRVDATSSGISTQVEAMMHGLLVEVI